MVLNAVAQVFNGNSHRQELGFKYGFNGKNIINNLGNINRAETGDFADTKSPAESGVVSVPINHPVVRSIVSYFQNLKLTQ